MSLDSVASTPAHREYVTSVVTLPRVPAALKVKPLGTRSGLLGQIVVAAGDTLCLALSAATAVGIEVALYGEWSWSLAAPLIGLTVGLLLAFQEGRIYASVRRHPVAEFRHTCLMILALGFAATAASLTAADHRLAATLLLSAVTAVLFFAIPVARYFTRHTAARASWWGRRVVIVGGGESGVKLYQLMQRRPHLGLRPVGIVEDLEQLSLEAEPASYLGPISELPRVAEEYGVSLGVLVSNEGAGRSLDLLLEGSVLPDWLLVAGQADRPGVWLESMELGGLPALSVRNHLRFASARRLKRAMDISLTLIGGTLLLPLVALIALAIRLTSPGPVFFRQERTGYNGRRFLAWKFRSMHVNAEALLQKHLESDPELKRQWQRTLKMQLDPRVTPLGRWLRKTSLDELPQLWNVLMGDMSLVGPRPLPDTDVVRYDQLEVFTKALPGITGLWQISGRSNTTFEERVAYDSFYVRNWSPWFDLYILACTVRVVLMREGALYAPGYGARAHGLQSCSNGFGHVSFSRKSDMDTVAAATVVRRVGRGAIWAFSGRILGVTASLALLFLLPRYVTPAEFGAFSLITSLMMIFSILGMCGLNEGNVRFLAEAAALGNGNRVRFLLRGSLKLTLIAASLSGIVAGVGLSFSRHAMLELASPWLLGITVAVGVVLLSLQIVSAESLRGLHQMRAASLLSGGGTGGALTTAVFVLAATAAVACGFRSLAALQVIYIASLAAVLPLTLTCLATAGRDVLAGLPAAEAQPAPNLVSLFREGLPYLGLFLLAFCTLNGDLWLVSLFCSMGEVGLYAAARRLTMAVAVAGQVVSLATMSSIPDLSARGRLAELEVILRRTSFYAWLPSVAASIPLLLWPGWVLSVVSGPEYATAAPILRILAAGNLLLACFGNPLQVLTMTGRQYTGLGIFVVTSLILVVGGVWAGGRYGLVGVATVTAFCLVLQSVTSWWLAKRLVGVWTHIGFPGSIATATKLTTTEGVAR